MTSSVRIISIALLSGSLLVSSWLVSRSLSDVKKPVPLVTVKGLAEKDVKADLAIWPIRFVRTGDNLQEIQKNIDEDTKKIHTFLASQGLADTIFSQSTKVFDREAQQYSDGKYTSRFILTRTFMIRTPLVNKVSEAYQASNALFNDGIVLDKENETGEPVYTFNGLNTLKPAMLSEAIKNAKISALQFAKDSGSQLGGIQRADQGVIEIFPQDKSTFFSQEKQINKTLRVVVTLQYRLEKG